ncbi:hypothetical protein BN132_3913 [Cronobacter turicensis 564]|nr:hypothetical protein BN132_3913 [Cronobacter turicensis 564]
MLDRRHVAKPHRRAVLIGDDQVAVLVGGFHLIVRGERHGALRAVETALRRVDVRAGNGGAHRFAVNAQRRQRLRVKLHPHRRTLPAGERHQPHAGHLRDTLRDAGFHHIFHLGHRQRRRGDRKRHNRRVRRVHFAVDRRVREIVRQQVGGGVNGGLHLLFGDIQRQR